MAMIFPPAMMKTVRKAQAASTTPPRSEGMCGEFVGVPVAAPSPEAYVMGAVTVPVWCSECGNEVHGEAIRFEYNFWPRDSRSAVVEHWIHPKCP